MAVLELSGTPAQRGRDHGEALRAKIVTSVERYREDIGRARGAGRAAVDEYLRELVHGTGLLRAMRAVVPALADELEGIAHGACLPLFDVAALNLMDEESCRADREQPESCSSIGLAGDARVVAGQTMDLTERHAGLQTVLRIVEDERETLVLTSAGMLGLCGVSSPGVAVFCNQLVALASNDDGVPVAAVTRGALAAGTLAEARAFIERIPHACGQNYLLAGPEGILFLECSANAVCARGSESALVHTNHPLVSNDYAAGRGPGSGGGFSRGSQARHAYLTERVRAEPTPSEHTVRALLSDRTTPICKVPEDGRGELTFGAVVVAFEAGRMQSWFTLGPPDRKEWLELSPALANDQSGDRGFV